jgi:hypothetical protein
MKDYMQEADRRSSWLDWQPKSPNITRTPEREPSKPTEPLQIEGRKVKRVYFEDAHQVWFQDVEIRFWYYSLSEKKLTELIPRDYDPETPIPREIWEAFGSLLGLVILKQVKPTTNSQKEEEA